MSEPDELAGTRGVNYDIPMGLHARAKALASLQGRTFKAWLIRAIEAAVEQQEAERAEGQRQRRR